MKNLSRAEWTSFINTCSERMVLDLIATQPVPPELQWAIWDIGNLIFIKRMIYERPLIPEVQMAICNTGNIELIDAMMSVHITSAQNQLSREVQMWIVKSGNSLWYYRLINYQKRLFPEVQVALVDMGDIPLTCHLLSVRRLCSEALMKIVVDRRCYISDLVEVQKFSPEVQVAFIKSLNPDADADQTLFYRFLHCQKLSFEALEAIRDRGLGDMC